MSTVTKATATTTTQPAWKDRPAYLLAAGWEPTGDPEDPRTTWYDPTVPAERPKDVKKPVARVKQENGEYKVIEQWHAPSLRLPMSQGEAVATQIARDKKKVG